MSLFGLDVISTTDSSLLLSSEAENSVFLGKAAYVSAGEITSAFGYLTVPITFLAPLSTEAPTIFIGGFDAKAGRYCVKNVSYSGGRWHIVVLIAIYDANNAVHVPDVYCFGSGVGSGLATEGTHGLQLKKSDGGVTFDSRWNRKLLLTKQHFSYDNGSGTNIATPASLAKPAWLWSGNMLYTSFLATSSPTTAVVSVSMCGMPLGSSGFGVVQFPRDVVQNAQYIPSLDQKFSPTSEVVHVAIIDGADYD